MEAVVHVLVMYVFDVKAASEEVGPSIYCVLVRKCRYWRIIGFQVSICIHMKTEPNCGL
jgi:hypothetical protein